jgi:hypothetical protein
MSRTLGSILTVAGSAALIASGVGAVAGSAILGSLAGATSIAGVSTALLATVGTALTVAGSLTSAIAGAPSPKAETTTQAIRTERPPRVSAYGRSKMHGAWKGFE